MSATSDWDLFTHELRRHIREIVSESQMVLQRDGDTLTNATRTSLERIASAGASCDDLIRAMYEFQSADAKPDLQAPLDRLLRMLHAELEPAIRPATLRLHLEGDTGVAVPVSINRVAEELIRNAAKFGATDIVLHAAAGPEVQIEVRDNGPGVPADYHAQIFEPFRRLHPPGEFAGHGLGLAVARRLVHKLGGSLMLAASQPGQGSTFVLTVPNRVHDTVSR